MHPKASESIGILCKFRHLLPLKHVQTFYHTLVEPYVNYCCLVWAGMKKTVILERIHKLQKKYCRIITFSCYTAHSLPLFKSLGIFTIYSINKLLLFLYRLKQMNNLLSGANPLNFNKVSPVINQHCT